jgi:hypothetical protein
VVDEPGHAQAVEFLVEEVDPELTWKKMLKMVIANWQ